MHVGHTAATDQLAHLIAARELADACSDPVYH
jgi:hypothetical protein